MTTSQTPVKELFKKLLEGRRYSHLLLAGASTGDLSLLVQEVDDAAEEGQQQQTQYDHYYDHPTALCYTKTQRERRSQRSQVSIDPEHTSQSCHCDRSDIYQHWRSLKPN